MPDRGFSKCVAHTIAGTPTSVYWLVALIKTEIKENEKIKNQTKLDPHTLANAQYC